ncbi:MAG: hypothetical protein R3E96_11950 [Planctomycetota bacterium]
MKSRPYLLPVFGCLTLIACSKEPEVPAPAPAVQPAPAAPQAAAQAGPGSTAAAQAPAQTKKPALPGGFSLHQFVPKDTIGWVEVESFDALVAAFQQVAGDALPKGAGPTDPEGALALLQMMGLPADRLQRDKPLALAISLELGQMEPRFTAMLPMDRAEATAEALRKMGEGTKVEVHDPYLVISNRAVLDADEDMAATLSKVRDEALFALHVDCARLMDRYGAMMEQGLQGQLKGAAPADMQKGAKMGVDALLALARGVRSLVRMDVQRDVFEMTGGVRLRSGSVLTELGSDQASDLLAMLRYVDVDRDEFAVGTVRHEALRFLLDPIMELADERARSKGQASVWDAWQQGLSFFNGDSADFAMSAGAQDFGLFVQGLDSARLLPLVERQIEGHMPALPHMSLMPPRKGENEVSRFAQYDLVADAGSPAVERLRATFGQPRLRCAWWVAAPIR